MSTVNELPTNCITRNFSTSEKKNINNTWDRVLPSRPSPELLLAPAQFGELGIQIQSETGAYALCAVSGRFLRVNVSLGQSPSITDQTYTSLTRPTGIIQAGGLRPALQRHLAAGESDATWRPARSPVPCGGVPGVPGVPDGPAAADRHDRYGDVRAPCNSSGE